MGNSKSSATLCVGNTSDVCNSNDGRFSFINEYQTSFAILTDIQYADSNDQLSLTGGNRYYRQSLSLVKQFVADLKELEQNSNIRFDHILQLGDLIDGKSKLHGDSKRACECILNELEAKFKQNDTNENDESKTKIKNNVLHVWGNHDLYNFKREEICNSPLSTASRFDSCRSHAKRANYYAFNLTQRVRLICLDFYEFSALGYDKQSEEYEKSIQLVRSFNKNLNLNSCKGLKKELHRYCLHNGAISDEQLRWLKIELDECRNNHQVAIVCGHLPLHAKAASYKALAWNSDELLQLFAFYKHTVVLYMAGHYHPGGYYYDKKKNLHHITVAAVLEAKPNTTNSYLKCHVYTNSLQIQGVGQNPTLTIKFKK